MATGTVTLGFFSRTFRGLSPRRRLHLDSRATRLGETDCNSLLRGTRTVLAFANVVYLFAYELSRLR